MISRRLGHSSVAMTLDLYGHVLKGAQSRLANLFAEYMEDAA